MSHQVESLTVLDDGSGPQLFAGGHFLTSGNTPCKRVARWSGSAWLPLDAGITDNEGATQVEVVCALDLPIDDGPSLYVGGNFGEVNNGAAANVAKWNGQWRLLHRGHGVNSDIIRVYEFDLGEGPELYAVAGYLYSTMPFSTAGNVPSRVIARWNGASWSPLGRGIDSGYIWDAVVFDDGAGPALYIAGSFQTINDQPINHIAKWDGQEWSSLDGGMNDTVRALKVYDDGTGPALYAAGHFTIAGDVPANRIAKWNGQQWARLGGLGNGVSGGEVRALAVFAGDGTPKLYVGGAFTAAGGDPAIKRLASWVGNQWHALENGSTAIVTAFDVLDDPLGPALYVRSSSTSQAARRWNGNAFTMEVSITAGSSLESFIVHDDGSGPALFVGGSFISIGHASTGFVVARGIAKWNGTTWSALGAGLQQCEPPSSQCKATAYALAVADDGSPDGPVLYVGGNFLMAGGMPVTRIAKWNGTTWSAVTPGINEGVIRAFQKFRGEGPASLYMAGGFWGYQPTTEPDHFTRIEFCDPETPPEGFELMSPAGGQVIQTLAPALLWSQALGLYVRYDVQVATDPAMTQPIYAANDLLRFSTALPAGIMEFEGDYYWSVRAHNPIGEVTMFEAFKTIRNPDINATGTIDVDDLISIIVSWGECKTETCPPDLDRNNVVDVDDLLILINHWPS